MRPLGLTLLAILSILAATVCEMPPQGPPLDPGDAAEVDCSACHLLEELTKSRDDGSPPRDWLREQGQGVIRDPAVLSLTGAPVMHLFWPSRGNHADEQLEDCSVCHPVYGRTSGHGLARYPEEAERHLFAPGQDCGRGCHGWIAEQATLAGFQPAAGAAPGYSGSLRPADLLESSGAAHLRVWLDGYTEDEQSEIPVTAQALEPGCGGCHNRFIDGHGQNPTCTACHDLAESSTHGSHARHVERIEADLPARAPALAGEPACSFCHCRNDAPAELCRPACYNCHLSGHSPRPLLWQ